MDAGNLSTANSILNSVTPDPKYNAEMNRKIVMEVYLHSWALDNLVLTEGQVDSLIPIADQACITGGSAVFDARNMLRLEVHDSTNVRMAQQIFNGTVSTGLVYPNPSTGQISIESEIPEGQIGELSVYDLMGRRIASWQLTGGQKVYSFDASFLSTGTYIYCVTVEGKLTISDRLIMIKEE